MKESLVKKTLQENPSILNGSGPLQRTGTKLKTIIILVAVSSSLTMLLYLGVQIYKVSSDTSENVGPKSAFLPLWLSFDWPWERKFSFPKYLAYFDSEYYAYVDSVSNFTEELRSQKVETEKSDSFDIWIECKHPTVHGPTIRISKEHGKLRLSWKWTVHPLSWWGSIDRALTASGLKLDRLDNTEAMKKTHEKSSGRVHEVNTSKDGKLKRVLCSGDKEYSVLFKGSFHLSNSSTTRTGRVSYQGMIDFDHIGINRCARLTSVGLTVHENASDVSYKVV
ncbi:hypothetical protein ACI3LZ_003359 [Candidozyma auris]